MRASNRSRSVSYGGIEAACAFAPCLKQEQLLALQPGAFAYEVSGMQLVFSRRAAGDLFKLAAEMLHMLVAALKSDFSDAVGALQQIFFCQLDPAVDDILHR